MSVVGESLTDESLTDESFTTHATKAIAKLKEAGTTPWDALHGAYATDPDVLNQTLAAARTQVPFIHGEPGVCYAGFQPCP